MAFQVDIIPATGTAYFTTNIEDGIALADETLRADVRGALPGGLGADRGAAPVHGRRARHRPPPGRAAVLEHPGLPAAVPPAPRPGHDGRLIAYIAPETTPSSEFTQTIAQLPATHLPTLAVGLLTIVAAWGLKTLDRRAAGVPHRGERSLVSIGLGLEARGVTVVGDMRRAARSGCALASAIFGSVAAGPAMRGRGPAATPTAASAARSEPARGTLDSTASSSARGGEHRGSLTAGFP